METFEGLVDPIWFCVVKSNFDKPDAAFIKGVTGFFHIFQRNAADNGNDLFFLKEFYIDWHFRNLLSLWLTARHHRQPRVYPQRYIPGHGKDFSFSSNRR